MCVCVYVCMCACVRLGKREGGGEFVVETQEGLLETYIRFVEAE